MIHFHYHTFSIDGPTIYNFIHSAALNVGNNASFSCTAEGNPEPVVTWYFQNRNLTTGKQKIMLKISKAKLANAGEYSCTAANEVGLDTRNLSLTVKGKSDVIGVNVG